MAERGELFARGFIRAYTDRITELEAENLALFAKLEKWRATKAPISFLGPDGNWHDRLELAMHLGRELAEGICIPLVHCDRCDGTGVSGKLEPRFTCAFCGGAGRRPA